MSKTIKQHFIPKFKLKQWLNDEDYLIIHRYKQETAKDTKVSYDKKHKSFVPDMFYKEYFYEDDNFKFNEVEDNLAWLESKFAAILLKLKQKLGEKSLMLKRKELEIIKCFLFTSELRGNVFHKRLETLDGDSLFREINKNLTPNERNLRKLKEINNLIIMIKEAHSCKTWTEAKESIKTYNSTLNPLNNGVLGGLWSDFYYSTIKIFKTKSEFLLTDNSSSQIINPVLGITPLINLHPVSKEVCIGLLPSNGPMRFAESRGAPDILKTSEGWKSISKSLSIKSGKFKNINHEAQYKYTQQTPKQGKYSWEDKFKYYWSTLDYHETGVVNCYLINQSLDFVVYSKNREVMEYAFELEKKYKMYRIEEAS